MCRYMYLYDLEILCKNRKAYDIIKISVTDTNFIVLGMMGLVLKL